MNDQDSQVMFDYIQLPDFKRLLYQVQEAQDKLRFKSLAIMSNLRGEGKTFISHSLSVGYAYHLQRRVLLVDAVVPPRGRSLRVNQILPNQESGYGVDLLQPHEHDQVDEDGNGRSLVSFSGDFQITKQIDEMKQSYDLTILDTCAIEATSSKNFDPIVIGKGCDASLVVTSKLSMNQASMRQLKGQFANWKKAPIGTVYNQLQ